MDYNQAPNIMDSDLNLNLNLNLGPYPPAPPYPEYDPVSDLWGVNFEDIIGSQNNPVSMERDIPAVDNTSGENKDEKKTDQRSFFDCNICLGISNNPVVTCCGHLFCWSCLYKWLYIHSDAQQCPVCKGEVTMKTITPIYGHGHANGIEDHGHGIENDDPTLMIPARPQANRVESWRETIDPNMFIFPELDEMFRILDNTPNYIPEDTNNIDDATLFDNMLDSRRMGISQNLQQEVDEIVNTDESRWFSHVMMRRQQAERVITVAAHAAFNQQQHHHHHHPLSGEDRDRDSVSSIVAVIQGSQVAGEIDSASSSRRALDASNMDSGDSRPPSRRRL